MKMVISVGSNLDEPIAQVDNAIEEIAREFRLVSQSSRYRTEPIGGPEQEPFINAVVVIESDLPPVEVLGHLHNIEDRAGRTREVRWGPRTLDLDLINVDGVVSEDPNCTLPHPRAHERGFVLVPWLEIDSEANIAGLGKVSEIGLPDQEVVKL